MKRVQVKIKFILGFMFIFGSALGFPGGSSTQSERARRAIDMMILIDNSCSMYPKAEIASGCETWGNDPEFLRVTGADLFFARLGFAEVNEADYQVGVIGIGEEPTLISPLQPLSGARDTLARMISAPKPERATKIVPALNRAYEELAASPNRRPLNLPAIVLITDGAPYPREGQSEADIEQLLNEHPDVPVFIMLLQNPGEGTPASATFEQYVAFWQRMQLFHKNVFTYQIDDSKKIEATYNVILAQLQNTTPTDGISVTPDRPLSFYVSPYVQRIIITVLPDRGKLTEAVTVEDSKGRVIAEGEPGVEYFVGTENPIRVISIGAPRLDESLKSELWTVFSEVPVTIFLDLEGAYRINFLNPVVSLTDVTNVYLATERQTPLKPLALRFNLLDSAGMPVRERQDIYGKVIYGETTSELRIPKLEPDAEGIYEFRFDFGGIHPDVFTDTERVIFLMHAGSAGGAEGPIEERIPIASARLLVDVGRGPIIEGFEPELLLCEIGKPAVFSVRIEDQETVLSNTLRIRVLGHEGEVDLAMAEAGLFSEDLAELCKPLMTGMPCSTREATTFRVRLVAQLKSGEAVPAIEREFPVQVLSMPCTPTPLPSPTPTPIPPPGDQDGDGVSDPEDRCPEAGEVRPFAWFGGCPPPFWFWIMGGGFAMAAIAFLALYGWPWIHVNFLAPPPKAYVLICRAGEPNAMPKSIYSIGMAHRVSRVTIGGDPKKAHIHVPGLKPVEFVVERRGARVLLLDAKTQQLKATFSSQSYTQVRTTVTEVNLRVGLDQSKLGMS